MLKRILSALPIGRKSDASDAIPTPDLSRIFPHMRMADQDAPETDDAVEKAETDDAAAPEHDAWVESEDEDWFDEVEPAEAETALDDAELEADFDGAEWLKRDVAALAAAFEMFTYAPNRSGSIQDLYRAAHNLRGTAEPCGVPVIARLSASLCDLIDGRTALDGDVALVNLHVKAIRAAESSGDAADPLADAVCVALEDQVRAKTAG